MKKTAGKYRALAVLFVLVSLMWTNLLTVAKHVNAQQNLPYKDAKLSIDARVKDLLSRMTIEEKAAQMMCLWNEKPNDNTGVPKELQPLAGEFSPALAKQKMQFGIGQIARQREARDPKRAAEYA